MFSRQTPVGLISSITSDLLRQHYGKAAEDSRIADDRRLLIRIGRTRRVWQVGLRSLFYTIIA
jgi:hypothetical protein